MEVNYNEIRENVIAKMMEHASTMESILSSLSGIVGDITACNYLTGEAANAYVTEFEDTVQTTFSRINLNITNIAEQLEKVCKEYEQMDADLRDQLN